MLGHWAQTWKKKLFTIFLKQIFYSLSYCKYLTIMEMHGKAPNKHLWMRSIWNRCYFQWNLIVTFQSGNFCLHKSGTVSPLLGKIQYSCCKQRKCMHVLNDNKVIRRLFSESTHNVIKFKSTSAEKKRSHLIGQCKCLLNLPTFNAIQRHT